MQRKLKKWTAGEERKLLSLMNSGSRSHAFIAFSRESGRSVDAVRVHYYQSMKSHVLPEEEESTHGGKWTTEEDAVLERYIDSGVANLKATFIRVSEQIGRTPTAVAAHWYGVLSKGKLHYSTVTPTYVTKNRKNGAGVPINSSIWQRVFRIICNVFS